MAPHSLGFPTDFDVPALGSRSSSRRCRYERRLSVMGNRRDDRPLRALLSGTVLPLSRGGMTTEALPKPRALRLIDDARGGFLMPLTGLAVDDGPHNMDGLLLHARDGSERVEAFISRRVME
jgi:hypothetical protein